MNGKFSEFQKFFYPESILVVGVSPAAANLGRNIVSNLLLSGYNGEILSVGRTPGVVFGQRIHMSIEEIGRPVDLAVVLTPAATVPAVLDECGRMGIRRVVVESGGFTEMGPHALPVEEACRDACERHSIRMIGPNCIGVTNMECGVVLPFLPMGRAMKKGPVSILAQSGGVGLSYLGFIAEENIGVNKFVSMGNKLDIDENDLLEYLIEDPGTGIILVHLESFSGGRRFLEAASRSPKPVLVHKTNRFEASAEIARSHTGAMASDDRLADCLLEQAGCVRVNTMADAMDCIKILTLPPLKGGRLGVVSRSGGHAVIAADACGRYGFHLPPFPEDFIRRIEEKMRAKVIRLRNPMDLGDLFDVAFYERIVGETLMHDDVDGVLLVHGYRKGFEQEESRLLVKKIEELVDRHGKPVAVVMITEAVELAYLKANSRIPIFHAPENAMRALHLSHRLATRSKPAALERPEGIDIDAGLRILDCARSRGHCLLSESLDLLEAYNIPIVKYRLARSPEQGAAILRDMSCPVAVKVNRPHVDHKTDSGLVRLDCRTEEDLAECFDAFRKTLDCDDVEILIQPMAGRFTETIVGGKRDAVFGPVGVFGLGGVFVEVLEDVVWRTAPIPPGEADKMTAGLKGRALLEGVRGRPRCDSSALRDIIVRVSHLLSDLQDVAEMDINPVAAMESGAAALDARVIVYQSR
jgi:acetate---CoA ligase (ADP-forming)